MPRPPGSPSSLTLLALLLALLACARGTCVREAAELFRPDGGLPTTGAETDAWWASSGTSLVEADVDGDGVLDVIGLATDPGGTGPLHVGAFDGQTFRQIWRSAPLGDATNAYLVQLGVAGGRVVATDPLGVLHVLDAASGKEVAHLQLGDRADAICAPREDPRRLWIALKDRTTGFLDPAAPQKLVSAPRPASCPLTGMIGGGTSVTCTMLPPGPARSGCEGREAPPFIPGFLGIQLALDGDDAVVSGMKTPGSAVPMIAGFTPGGGGQPPALRWQHGVAAGNPLAAMEGMVSMSEMAGGRVAVTYEDLEGGHHVVALDAASGKTLWDEKTETLLHLRLSPTRAYVLRWTRLDVRDAATGRLLGGVGAR